MVAEIITIGDEILIGQIVDTNSAWIAKQFNSVGIKVNQIISISDNKDHIVRSLNSINSSVGIVIITGGLGPTKDDITKQTLCDFFDTKLIFNEAVFEDVEAIFKHRNLEVTGINRKQAEVPEACIPLRNKNGTAPGMWFEKDGRVYVSLPGVPYEMKALMSDEVIPRLVKQFQLPAILHKTVLTQGIGESFLSEKIADWENSLAAKNIKLAYLPSPGMVRLRLSTNGEDASVLKANIEQKVDELQQLIPQYIYGYDEDTLEEIVGKMLRERRKTLATAESCTGGYISHLVTRVPGSSDYYLGSVIAYDNEVKINELSVNGADIDKYGVVSEEVVRQMALGVCQRLKANCAITTSGIAGPSGGTPEKPVGTTWIAVAVDGHVKTKKYLLGEHRQRNIHVAAITGLNMLRKLLVELEQEKPVSA